MPGRNLISRNYHQAPRIVTTQSQELLLACLEATQLPETVVLFLGSNICVLKSYSVPYGAVRKLASPLALFQPLPLSIVADRWQEITPRLWDLAMIYNAAPCFFRRLYDTKNGLV